MSELSAVLRALGEFGDTFDKVGDAPNSEPVLKTAALDDANGAMPSARKVLSYGDRVLMQKELMKLSNDELIGLAFEQLRKDRGIPIEKAWSPAQYAAAQSDPIISKILDTGATALQRQDLEPILYPVFVRAFPAYERFVKEPSNGLVHTWNQITAYGDAQFMTELGTVTDDSSTYVRQTTNIAQLGTRRGVTFKEQLAVPAGGMAYNPQQLEIENGLIAMAHKLQKTIFQGQASNSGGTASNELGAYDANGFTGLRSIMNTSDAVNGSPYLTSSPDNIVTLTNSAVSKVMNNVGVPPTAVFGRVEESAQFANQQIALQRFVDRTEVIPGVMVPTIATAAGVLPIMPVPGDSIGHYTATTFSSKDVADWYVLNERQISLPYLGSPGPAVIEIPPGVSGQLTRLFIVYAFMGLAVKVIPASNKVRMNLATS